MRQVISITDLGYGDSGKGTMVDAYAGHTNAHTVVRASGGAQAAHNVVTDDGRHHTFSQFGSATFRPGTRTHLSRFMLVYPPTLVSEEKQLQKVGVSDAFDRLTIDGRAPLITPFHRAANWLREMARNGAEHGTCGMGIGETVEDLLSMPDETLYAYDLLDARQTALKVRLLRAYKREQMTSVIAQLPRPLKEDAQTAIAVLEGSESLSRYLELCATLIRHVKIVDPPYLGTQLALDGTIIFEGAQGVLLDEWYGFHPHTTWTTTTNENPNTLLCEHEYSGEVRKIGVLRAYATRHGAGPFVTEDAELTQELRDPHNQDSGWQRAFRVGWFDLVASQYALDVVGKIDGLAITCLDRIAAFKQLKICDAYTHTGETTLDLNAFFRMAGSSQDRIDRMRVDRTRNLVRQEQLTHLVKDCRPVYRDVTQRGYLLLLADRLNTPIVATSSGLAAKEKRFSSSV